MGVYAQPLVLGCMSARATALATEILVSRTAGVSGLRRMSQAYARYSFGFLYVLFGNVRVLVPFHAAAPIIL